MRLSSSAARTVTSTDSGVSGFSRNWNAPSLTARTASVSCALPLIMITGVRAAALADAREGLQPVGARRHQQVEQDDVGIDVVELQQRRVPVGRLRHGEPLLAEQRGQHPADVGLVVHQQDLGARRVTGPRIRTTKVAPPPGVGSTAMRALVHLDRLLGQGEARGRCRRSCR